MDVVIATLPDAPPELRSRLQALGELREVPRNASAAGMLSRSDCAVVEAPTHEALGAIRRLHAADPALQTIMVVRPEERRQVERALLFAPGLGEIWLLTRDEVDGGAVERASEVTRKRRRYRTTRRRIEEDLAAAEPQRTRRARISDTYLAALLQVLPDPVISVDDAGVVLSWNPAAERLLGYPGSQAVGKHVVDLVAPNDRETLQSALEASRHATWRGEIRFRARTGQPGMAEVILVPVEAAGHDVRSLVMHDVTEQRQARVALEEQARELEHQATQLQEQAAELEMLNVQLQERTLELEEAMTTRSRFYAAMSHELRTPMNAIIGYNALLLDELYGPLPPKQADAVRRSQRAAQHLLELVNDVLDLAKIEAGRIEILIEPTEFPRLLRELIDTVRPMAEEHETEVILEDEQQSVRVFTDPRRVRQILLNLLSNAIKFGKGKPVRVACSPLEDGGVRVDVIDQGRGIAPENLRRIFEEFVQIDDTSGSGTGLGLPISRRLAHALGGDLEVSSTQGEGSTFSLTLPRDVPPVDSSGG